MKVNLSMVFWVLYTLLIMVGIFLFSCRSKPSLEGFYLRYAEHEFGKAWDTLLIKPITADAFRVTHKWKYERVLDGKAITPEYKSFHTTVAWLGKEGLLIEEETGLRYRLKGETLAVGETLYKKVK